MNYNTKYVCSYNDSDVFLESEIQILNDDEKNFIRDALYRRDLCNIFNIDDQVLDETKISDNIKNLYKIINGQKFLNLCITKISNNFFYSNIALSFL